MALRRGEIEGGGGVEGVGRRGDAGVPVRRGSFSFRVICGSLVVRIDAASRPITIHRTTITPQGYIPAHHILVSLSPSLHLSLSLSLARIHALLRALLPFSSHHLTLSLPTFFISTCLITNNQAYLPPFRLRKIARDLNYCALLLSLSRMARVTIRYFSGRDSNYPTRCELLFIGRSYRIFRSPFLSQF